MYNSGRTLPHPTIMPLRYIVDRMLPDSPWKWIHGQLISSTDPNDKDGFAPGSVKSHLPLKKFRGEHILNLPVVEIRGNLGWDSEIPKPIDLNPVIRIVGKKDIKRVRDALIVMCKMHKID